MVVDSPELAVAKTDYLRTLSMIEAAAQKIASEEEWLHRMSQIEVRLTAVDYLKARELLAIARRNHEREESLLGRGTTSEKEMLDARSLFLTAESEARALEKKLGLLGLSADKVTTLAWEAIEGLEGTGTASRNDLHEARQELAAARAESETVLRRLVLFGLTTSDLASLAASRDTSGLLPLRAPFEGLIVDRTAVVGESVDAAKSLVELADTRRLWACLDVQEADVARLAVGQEVVLAVDGIRGDAFPGTVSWIAPAVDRETRTVEVRATFDNASGALRAHQYGRAVVATSPREPALLVPKSAVQWEGCCNVVFVKRSETEFEPRKVWLGIEAGESFVVREGLEEGDPVVTTGSFLLKTEILKGAIGAGCCGND